MKYFVSEACVYRLLKAHDLVTCPAFIVVRAADEFKDKTMAPNQLRAPRRMGLSVTRWPWPDVSWFRRGLVGAISRFLAS
jgi:putative transposase